MRSFAIADVLIYSWNILGRYSLILTSFISLALSTPCIAQYQPQNFDVAIRKLLHDATLAAIYPEAQRIPQMRLALARNLPILRDAVLTGDPQLLADSIGPATSIDVSGMEIALIQELIRTSQPLAKMPNADRLESRVIDSIPELALVQLIAHIRKQLNDYQPSKHPALQQLISPQTGISVRDPSLQLLVQEYLPRYFDSLTIEDKGRYAAAILNLPPDAALPDKLASLMQASNVLMQKLMQLLGKDIKSPVLAEALVKLQNDVIPFPTSEAIQIIELRTGKKINDLFVNFPAAPLAAGTIGQVYKATLRGSQEVVIVKVRRPGALESIERDVKVLEGIVDDPTVRSIVSRAADVIRREADFRIEAKYLEDGEVYVDEKAGISIARRHQQFPASEDMLTTKLAAGRNLADVPYEGKALELRGRAVAELLRRWFGEAMFGEGFFHGDLHPGNMFLADGVGRELGFLLTLIDFGNSGRLSLGERQSFAKIAASVAFGDVNGIVIAFSQLDPTFDSQRQQVLRAELAKQVDSATGLYAAGISRTMEIAGRSGVQISATMVSFSRAEMFLSKELDRVNAALKKIDPKAKGFERLEIYRSVGLQSCGRRSHGSPNC